MKKQIIQSFIGLFFLVGISFSMGAQETKGKTEVLNQSSSLVKGKAFVGGSFGVSTNQANDTKNLLGVAVNESKTTKFDIDLYGGYFLKDNLALGMRVGFSSEKTSRNAGAGAELSTNNEVYRGYLFSPFIRNYFTLDKNGVFNLFNETKIGVGFGEGISQTDYQNEITRTVSNSFLLNVGLSPGLAVIMGETVSVEAAVDILGLTSEWQTLSYDDRPNEGTQSSTDLDFSLSLLSLNLGIVFYFN